MAKKVVATLKTTENAKNWAKVIRAVKSEKTGAYTFREEMVLLDKVQEYLATGNKSVTRWLRLRKSLKSPTFVGLFACYLICHA